MGAVLAAALLAPLVLDRPDTPHRLLGNTTMVTLGRWSYGLFIWHLAALAMVFPVIGEFPFNGHMPVVLVLTLVFGFAIAAVSYAMVESPCRVALRRWELASSGRAVVGQRGQERGRAGRIVEALSGPKPPHAVDDRGFSGAAAVSSLTGPLVVVVARRASAGLREMRQQQRGWLVAQCLPTLQLAKCSGEVVGNIAPSWWSWLEGYADENGT